MLETAALAYKQEYIDHGEDHINGSCGFMKYPDYMEWLRMVRASEAGESPPFFARASTYFTVRQSDGKIVGSIQLRHQLSKALEQSGGHIGYGICPSERKKGYATQQLNLVLQIARKIGLSRVLITCDADNTASAKTAIRCGGVLSWEGYSEEDDTVIQKYWIDLSDL